MNRWLIVVAFVLVGHVAHAEPMVMVKATPQQVSDGLAALAEQLDEPVGLVAKAAIPALGLAKGDLVRAIDGRRALRDDIGGEGAGSGPVVYLDVRRGARDLVVRVEVEIGTLECHAGRAYFERELYEVRQYTDVALAPVTHAGRPVGVLARMPFAGGEPILEEGDVVRRVDGTAVTTPMQLLDALDAAKDHARIALDIERLDHPVTITVVLEDEPKPSPAIVAEIAAIRRIDDHTYEVPKSLVDAVIVDVARQVQVIPDIKNGKPVGFKLYAIRPASLFAALGFMNGDTLAKVNGFELTSADKALEVYTKLREATSLEVEVVRHGQKLTLDYRIQ